eukprot:670969-Hanusia_phi.AAC.1
MGESNVLKDWFRKDPELSEVHSGTVRRPKLPITESHRVKLQAWIGPADRQVPAGVTHTGGVPSDPSRSEVTFRRAFLKVRRSSPGTHL